MRRSWAALRQLPHTGNTPLRRVAAWYRLIGDRIHRRLRVYSRTDEVPVAWRLCATLTA